MSNIQQIIQSARNHAENKAGKSLLTAEKLKEKAEKTLGAVKDVVEGSVGTIALGEGVRKGAETLKRTGKGIKSLAKVSVKLNKRLGVGTRQPKQTPPEDTNDVGETPESGPSSSVLEGGDEGTEMTSDVSRLGYHSGAVPEQDEALRPRSLLRRARDLAKQREGMVQEEGEFGEKTTVNPLSQEFAKARAERGALRESGQLSPEEAAMGDNEAAGRTVLSDGADLGAAAGDEGLEVAEITGETAGSAALDAVGGALEAAGDTEIATGVLAPVGVITDLLGGVGLVGGVIAGGVGIGTSIASHLGDAQDELNKAQHSVVSLAGRVGSQVSNHADLMRMR